MTPFVPVGDPEAMRATARALLAHADTVRSAHVGPAAAFAGMTLAGPSAPRLQAASEAVRQEAGRAATDLEAVAGRLFGDATQVELLNEEARKAAERATPPAPAPPAAAPVPAPPPAAVAEPPAAAPAAPPVPAPAATQP